MEFILWYFSSLILSLPLFKNPISMAAVVVLISLAMVVAIGLFSSFWFSYVLFLVYVGGLLVMFIYICLVSSNYPFKFNLTNFFCMLLGSSIFSLTSESVFPNLFLGFSNWVSGESLLEWNYLSLFLFLAVLLLGMLLVVVRISGSGCFSVSNDEKS